MFYHCILFLLIFLKSSANNKPFMWEKVFALYHMLISRTVGQCVGIVSDAVLVPRNDV